MSKKIIAITLCSLFFAAGINAQQATMAADKKAVISQQTPATNIAKVATSAYTDKQKRAEERAKAAAAVTAYNSSEHKPYPAKAAEAKPVSETKTSAPVEHSAAYTKRAEERVNHGKKENWGNNQSPVSKQ